MLYRILLFLPALAGSTFAIGNDPCLSQQYGSCYCELADGSGTIDLTSLKNLPPTEPFRDEAGGLTFLYSFCQAMQDPGLRYCSNIASVCGWGRSFGSDDNVVGLPETTHFEMRVDPRDSIDCMALVSEFSNPVFPKRAIAFIYCKPYEPVTFSIASGIGNQIDPDGFVLNYFDLTGDAFCTVENGTTHPPPSSVKPASTTTTGPGRNPCKSSLDDVCFCELADGSGVIDLTSLADRGPAAPFTTTHEKFSYLYSFCNVLDTVEQSNCHAKAVACEFDASSNNNLGLRSTLRWEIRNDATHPHDQIALVAEYGFGLSDATHRRSIAYIKCVPNQQEVNFKSYGNFDEERDIDGYYLYPMEFSGSIFCPVATLPTTVTVPSTTAYVGTNACKSSEWGTCWCDLLDGSGFINVTGLADDLGIPFYGGDSLARYSVGFCTVTPRSFFEECFEAGASVCRFNSFHLVQPIGTPESTRFEMRTDANHTVPQLAVVSEYVGVVPSDHSRSVIYLNCVPEQEDILFSFSDDYYQDPDQYNVYTADFRGSVFCPRSSDTTMTPPSTTPFNYPINPCKDPSNNVCVCDLEPAFGTGTVDLSSIVGEQYRVVYNGHRYYYTFCSVVHDTSQSVCDGVANSCFNNFGDSILGTNASLRWELRQFQNGDAMGPAIVSDYLDPKTGAKRRTVAFIYCSSEAEISMTAFGDLYDDPDGYRVYVLQFTGSVFCPSVATSSTSSTSTTSSSTTTMPVETTTAPTTMSPDDGDSDLSVGVIVTIALFGAIFLYFVGGIIINTFVFKRDGRERIPNVKFWFAVIASIRRGAMFLLGKCCKTWATDTQADSYNLPIVAADNAIN